jgi:hypothetical protein
MNNRKEIVRIDKKGRVRLPMWVAEGLFESSGSKATSLSGKRKAIKKHFIKLLREHVDDK